MQANILDLQRRAEVAASARRFARIGVAPRLSVLAGLVVLLLAAAAEADRLLYVDHLAVYDATGRRIGSRVADVAGRVGRGRARIRRSSRGSHRR